jgi:hypothetical protein
MHHHEMPLQLCHVCRGVLDGRDRVVLSVDGRDVLICLMCRVAIREARAVKP